MSVATPLRGYTGGPWFYGGHPALIVPAQRSSGDILATSRERGVRQDGGANGAGRGSPPHGRKRVATSMGRSTQLRNSGRTTSHRSPQGSQGAHWTWVRLRFRRCQAWRSTYRAGPQERSSRLQLALRRQPACLLSVSVRCPSTEGSGTRSGKRIGTLVDGGPSRRRRWRLRSGRNCGQGPWTPPAPRHECTAKWA